ncbi:MAG: hypothetical protein WC506_01410 [Candidatus Micrarchaeia archaeon]
MDLPALLFISIACGATVKFADSFADSGKKGVLGIAAGLAYGIMIGYLATTAGAMEIFIAAVLASAFAGKIDKKEHFTGVLALFFYLFAASMFVKGIQIENIGLLVAFLAAAYIDEARPIKGHRGVLDIAAILAGIAGFGWDSAMFIIAFDIGYLAMSALYPEKKPAKPPKRARKRG